MFAHRMYVFAGLFTTRKTPTLKHRFLLPSRESCLAGKMLRCGLQMLSRTKTWMPTPPYRPLLLRQLSDGLPGVYCLQTMWRCKFCFLEIKIERNETISVSATVGFCLIFTCTEFRFRFKKSTAKGKKMYEGLYLWLARHCDSNGTCFVKGKCHAEMRKRMMYFVDAEIDPTPREIRNAYCECTVGSGTTAPCKHLFVVLFGVNDMKHNKKILLRATCTEQTPNLPLSYNRILRCSSESPKFKVWGNVIKGPSIWNL